MLESVMILINFFLAPGMGLYLYMRREGWDFSFSVEPVLLYAAFVAWNIPVIKLFVVVARRLGHSVHSESGSYTLVALLSSIIVYGAAVVLKEYFHLSLKVGKGDEE